MFERLCDNFPEILSGERKSIQFEAFGDIHTVEMKRGLFTFTKDDGETVTKTAIKIDYENEKAIPFSLDGMEFSAEVSEKDFYFVNINRFLDKLEDNGFKEIEQDVQADRGGISL